ncbi:MAG TPA: hypothetical protein VKE22_10040 [Haliangiales bacterium]|nr:hypothetical protein [Haliangiales bacterium]
MIPPLGRLILAWLTTRPDGGPLSDLKKALARYAPAGVPEAVDELRAGGLVAVTRGRVRATDAGRAAGEELLGGKPTAARWATVERTQLLPRLLGADRAASADELRAAAIQAHEGLPRGLTLARTADALGWKLLGGTPGEPFTRERVLAFLVGRALGARVPDVAAAMRLAAARAAGARRADARELADAIVRRWLAGEAAGEEDLGGFARRVRAAAGASPSGRFGDNKVFISHVHAALADPALDLPAFKARLVDAHRQGLVTLTRADLVEAMDPADVAASETRYLGATFHFVRL